MDNKTELDTLNSVAFTLADFIILNYFDKTSISVKLLGAAVSAFNSNNVDIRDYYHITNDIIESQYPLLKMLMLECQVINKWDRDEQ